MSSELFLTLTFISLAQAKIYSHCELAKELLDIHEISKQQLATWVCIAEHESNMNTSAMNRGSGDHGLFQISELFWCSPPGYACGVSCEELRNDDIEDDVVCARRIFREHKRLSGDGFNAWVVYKLYCNTGDVSRYIEECFDGSKSKVGQESTSRITTSTEKVATNLVDRVNVKEMSSSTLSTPLDKLTGSTRKEFIKSTTEEILKISTIPKVFTSTTKKMSLPMSTEKSKENESLTKDSKAKLES